MFKNGTTFRIGHLIGFDVSIVGFFPCDNGVEAFLSRHKFLLGEMRDRCTSNLVPTIRLITGEYSTYYAGRFDMAKTLKKNTWLGEKSPNQEFPWIQPESKSMKPLQILVAR